VESPSQLGLREQWRNPVMLVVYVGSIHTTLLCFHALRGTGAAPARHTVAVALWLWFTVLFANLAEALAGRAQQGPARPRAASPRRSDVRMPPGLATPQKSRST